MKSLNQRGFTIVEVMVSTFSLSIGLVTLAAFSLNMQSSVRAAEAKAAALSLNQDVANLIYSKSNWKKTIEMASTLHPTLGMPVNPELACLRDGTSCAAGEHTLSLFDLNGAIRVDSQSPAAGFTRDGSPCTTFGALGTCLTNVTLTWTPACPASGPCIYPSVRIKTVVANRTFDRLGSSSTFSETAMSQYLSISNEPVEVVLHAPGAPIVPGPGSTDTAGCIGKRFTHAAPEARLAGHDDDDEHYSVSRTTTSFDSGHRSAGGTGRCIASHLHKHEYEDPDD